MNEQRRTLERIAGLLQLIQLDLQGCGECIGHAQKRLDIVVSLIDDLLDVQDRHPDDTEETYT